MAALPVTTRRRPRTLAAVFDDRRNGLNAIRLVLATSVVFWHSVPLTGRTVAWAPADQFFGSISVDGFFAISGYLIFGSWLARPNAVRFLVARVVRIVPGFWGSLLVTAAVLAPVGILLTGTGLPEHYLGGAARFVIENAALKIQGYDIVGTPLHVPLPHVWNGSLWTLYYEFLCYLGVLALGVAGLARRRFTALSVFLLALGFAIAVTFVIPSSSLQGFGHLGVSAGNLARFALMFTAGMVVHRYASRVPLRADLLVGAAALAVVASVVPRFEIIAALPIAYVMLGLGALVKSERLQFRNDLSYGMYVYAFPVQQVLAATALVGLPVVVFGAAATLLTLPLALFSWFCIEKPAKRLTRLRRRAALPAVVGLSADRHP